MARIKKKKIRSVIKLVSTAGTGYFYVTSKNPKRLQQKLMLRKYDPIVRQHVIFEERKIRGKGSKLYSTFSHNNIRPMWHHYQHKQQQPSPLYLSPFTSYSKRLYHTVMMVDGNKTKS